MPTFIYKALLPSGEKVSGRVSLESRAEVISHITSEKGLRPVSIEQVEPQGAIAGRTGPAGFGKFLHVNIEMFLRQIANLLNAGIPLNRALEIILRELPESPARQQWAAIREDIVEGQPLAAALSRWPKTFPAIYVAMVKAGETGGFLNLVLEQIADFRSRENDLKGRVKAALVYPALLVVVASAVLTFLLIYFIPQFAAIFEEFGGSLPALTRLIMSLSGFLIRYGLVFGVVAALIFVFAGRVLKGEQGRRFCEQAVLRIPVFGDISVRFAMVRFCRMLGTLLTAGVPLVVSLSVAREAIGNQSISDAVTNAIGKVKNGMSLAHGLSMDRKFFPGSVVEMIAVSEESGNLDKELLRLAGTYETELDRQLRILVAVIEPVLLFVMAAIVGVVVIGMLLPIFTLQELIR